MDIVTWGVRGSIPVASPDMQRYGGNTTCYQVFEPSTPTLLIVDAGTGLYNLGRTLPTTGEAHIFISHVHLDHVQGLPFFAPIHNSAWTIHLYLPLGTAFMPDALFDGQLFPMTRDKLKSAMYVYELAENTTVFVGNVRVINRFVPHTGVCQGFRFECGNEVACIIPDIELCDASSRFLAQDFMHDADIAFVDAHFTGAEYESHVGWGHSTYEMWPEIAESARVKHLVFSHHAPNRTDKELDAILKPLHRQYANLPVQLTVAVEGMMYGLQSEPAREASKDMNFVKWMADFSQSLLQFNDISTVLDRILLEARMLSKADAGTVFLREDDELVFAYTHNDSLFHVDMAYKYSYASARLPINTESIAGYCAATCLPLNLADVRHLPLNVPFTFNESFDNTTGYRTVSIYCLPLIGKNKEVLGVIQLINRMEGGRVVPFCSELVPSLTVLSVQAVSAIERSLMAREMILRMQMMAALNDPKETGPHVERVGAIAAELYQVIAEKKQVPIDVRRVIRSQIRLAAMLHDLGKVAIPQEVLKKPGKLTTEEFAIMQTHCCAGGKLFPHTSERLDEMAKIIAVHHHQKWNGTGYTGDPDVPLLAGEAIPLEARITAVADVFDALVSTRCYKNAWPWEDAVALLKQDAGSHFDPEIVDAFMEIENVIKVIYVRYQE